MYISKGQCPVDHTKCSSSTFDVQIAFLTSDVLLAPFQTGYSAVLFLPDLLAPQGLLMQQ